MSNYLAKRFNTVMVEEYGRPYCQVRPALTLELPDYEAIAWGQATWEDAAAEQANRVLICDTDLHTTATWSDLLLGTRPAWLTDAARARRYDLVILLDYRNTAWVDDGTRVLSGRREAHTQLLRAELEAAGRVYHEIGGGFASREKEVEKLVASLLEGANS